MTGCRAGDRSLDGDLLFARDGADVVDGGPSSGVRSRTLAKEIAEETGRRTLAVPSDHHAILDASETPSSNGTLAEFGRLDVRRQRGDR